MTKCVLIEVQCRYGFIGPCVLVTLMLGRMMISDYQNVGQNDDKR